METKKIAVACFVGGALCCAVALMFAPTYWWLGLMAGIATGVASGYVSYDFREILQKIPIAFRAAGRGGLVALTAVIDATHAVSEWFKKPHPFFYFSMLLGLFVIIPMNQFIFSIGLVKEVGNIDWVILAIIFYLEIFAFFGSLIYALSHLGSQCVERCYYQPLLNTSDIERLRAKGYNEKPPTYWNVLRWTFLGVAVIIYFFMWPLWKNFAIGAGATFCFLGRFAWHLFKLIHSKERTLCAIDGTLGGVASYIWLASSATSFAEQVVLVIFGGLLGAAFGVANWEIVSKRILHVHVKAPIKGA